jgi:hypothetical protein
VADHCWLSVKVIVGGWEMPAAPLPGETDAKLTTNARSAEVDGEETPKSRSGKLRFGTRSSAGIPDNGLILTPMHGPGVRPRISVGFAVLREFLRHCAILRAASSLH